MIGASYKASTMNDYSQKLASGFQSFTISLDSLISATPCYIGKSNPPSDPGVYLFLLNDQIIYVGEAKGAGGLRDRILNKHVSGDEGHALQRYFKNEFSDRVVRREHIKRNIQVKWVVVSDDSVPIVERLAIWLLNPPLNRT